MIKIKEIMQNEGFDYENPQELKQTDFWFALDEYKRSFKEFSDKSEDEKSDAVVSQLEMQEQNLIQIFNETVDSEPDPEIENLKQSEQEAQRKLAEAREQQAEAQVRAEEEREHFERERAENKRIADIREEKLNKILEKQKLVNDEKIYLLNNKRKLNYSELEKIGIDTKNAPRKFEWNGYVFEKQWMFKQYVILTRPK